MGLSEGQVACQGILEDVLADVEFDLTKLVMDSLQIGDQALVGGTLKDADGTDDGDADGHGIGAGFILIEQDRVGMDLPGEVDGIAFPAMASDRGIHRHRRRAYGKPRWWVCHPILDELGRGGMGQFLGDGGWDHHGFKQGGQHLNLANADQNVDGTGIRNNKRQGRTDPRIRTSVCWSASKSAAE